MKYCLFIICLLQVLSDGQAQSAYTNPVYKADFPDPTVIRGHDGIFYAYATNSSIDGVLLNIQVAKSPDLINWTVIGDALPEKPVWADKDFWAPHVLYDKVRQQYYMYYSGESPDDKTGKCIGVAISKTPGGPFSDIGKPLLSGEGFETIDPMAFDDPLSGKKYLYWGSGHRPIKIRELGDDRISFKPGSTTKEIVAPNEDDYSKLVEGAWLHYRDGYYYLFYSGDNCCGESAHYAIMVARSRHPDGPFEKLSKARGSKSSTILEKNNAWLAPGHNSIITDDAGADWIVYHAIALGSAVKVSGRIMLIDRLQYNDGWPSIDNGSPSTKFFRVPFIKKTNSK